MNKRKNVREVALELLELVDKRQSYSNLLLNQLIQKNKVSALDIPLLTEISYGTIQRKLTLDYYLKPFLRKEVEHWVRLLLRLSLYQMVYLDKVPDRAIIHEAVDIAKKRGHRGIAGLVNGVLRSVQRKGLPSLEEIKDKTKRLSIETSHPLWLVERWTNQFGFEKTKEMCEMNLLAPVQTARVNEMKATRAQAIQALEIEGFAVQPSPIIPVSIRALKGNLAHSKAYKDGWLTIQDESSMAVAYALELASDLQVLDACAAPGGKTTHIAERLANTGKVTALDLHPHKIKLIADQAKRLQLQNIVTHVLDSRQVSERLKEQSFDRVLVDAPCSGLGVLRKKPDIKYTKSEQDIESLKKIQRSILAEAAKVVTKGGLLVYSTCTVDEEENIGTVEHFFSNHQQFKPHTLHLPEPLMAFANDHILQIFPQDFGSDGFFIACFERK